MDWNDRTKDPDGSQPEESPSDGFDEGFEGAEFLEELYGGYLPPQPSRRKRRSKKRSRTKKPKTPHQGGEDRPGDPSVDRSPSSFPGDDTAQPGRRVRRTIPRWLTAVLVALLVLGTLVWFLPAILVSGPWRSAIVGWALADLKGTATVETIRLGWFSPVEAHGLKLHDADGGPLLELAHVRTGKTLLELIRSQRDLGRIYLEKPTLTVVVTERTTNWEQALAEYLKPTGKPQPTLRLEVIDATIHVVDRTAPAHMPSAGLPRGADHPSQRQRTAGTPGGSSAIRSAETTSTTGPRAEQTWDIEQLELLFELRGGNAPGMLVHANGTIRHGSQLGQLQASYGSGSCLPLESPILWPSGENASGSHPPAKGAASDAESPSRVSQEGSESIHLADATGVLDVHATAFPLPILRPLLARLGWTIDLHGTVLGNICCQWRTEKSGPAVFLHTALQGEGVEICGPATAGDRLAIPRFRTEGKLLWQNDFLRFERFSLTSGANAFFAQGTVPVDALRWPPVVDQLEAEPLEIRGQLDLAQLATQLPSLLRVRDDAQVQSGRLQFACSNRLENDQRGWKLTFRVDGLRAQAAGKSLAWDNPVGLRWIAQPDAAGTMQHSLAFWSDVLNVQAAGTLRTASGSAQFELERLTEQFGQLIDFGKFRLAGSGWMQFRWERPQTNQYVCDARLHVNGWHLTTADGRTWAEPQLVASAHLQAAERQSAQAGGENTFGKSSGNSTHLVAQTADLSVQAADDRVTLQLTEPVVLEAFPRQVAFRLESRGRLESWIARLAPFVEIAPWQAAGAYRAEAAVRVAHDSVAVQQASLQTTELQVVGPGIQLREPQASLAFSAQWQWNGPAAKLQDVQLAAGAVNATADTVVWNRQQGQLAGKLQFHGDLARLASWLKPSQTDGARLQLAGRCSGSAEFAHDRHRGQLILDAMAKDVQWRTSSGQVIREPSIELAARAERKKGDTRWTIQQLQLRSTSLAGAVSGWIDWGRQPTVCRFDGRITYDWDRVEPLVHLYVPQGVVLHGVQEGTFTWSGPLQAARATGSLTAGWQSGNIYGFPLGPAQMQLALSEGVLRLNPVEVAVAEGQANLAGSIRLDAMPRQLDVQSGRVLDRVRINPRMCAAALGYLAPPLAGVTRAEGSFSLELDACSIPIEQPEKGKLEGRLIIHSVEISAGPFLQALAQMLGRSATARLRSESVVPFQMVDGRVYHRDLELVFPEVTIRTWGSVGLDRSLALMVEMPVPQKLHTGQPVVDAVLRDQKVQIPVAGALLRPKLDQRALNRVVERAVKQAMQNLLQDQLPGRLEELFRLPRQ